MKLDKEIRAKIDKYFDNISADELYYLLTNKYNFIDKTKNSRVIINNQYFCNKDIKSEFFNDVMRYANLDIRQDVEIIKMKFLDDMSDYQNEESVYNQPCSIPLAA